MSRLSILSRRWARRGSTSLMGRYARKNQFAFASVDTRVIVERRKDIRGRCTVTSTVDVILIYEHVLLVAVSTNFTWVANLTLSLVLALVLSILTWIRIRISCQTLWISENFDSEVYFKFRCVISRINLFRFDSDYYIVAQVIVNAIHILVRSAQMVARSIRYEWLQTYNYKLTARRTTRLGNGVLKSQACFKLL